MQLGSVLALFRRLVVSFTVSFKPYIVEVCPFANLPEATSGRWGQGLTAGKMKECIWVRPRLVANFEFLEWTDSNHVRHIKFVALRFDKDPLTVVQE